MLVVDNNKMKLLKMKEKLLEVSPYDNQNCLNEFKNLAIDIDSEVFASLVDHIENTNYHDLPLEEQINVLAEFVQAYDDVNELQYSFKNVYQRYAGLPLQLSDMSIISIDSIKDRISCIEGYLLNNNNVENNKQELEQLNLDLIDEEKRRIDSLEIFKTKEAQLRNSFVNAEGRVAASDDAYISFVREFNILSLDLKQLLLDNQQLENELDQAVADKALTREEYEAAKVCYNYVPSFENKENCNAINKKLVFMEYKFALLEMASLIAKDFSEYDSVKLKREKLKVFNDMRVECLKKLDVVLLIDPFASLKINEQLEIIESYGDNKEKISSIRRKISNVNFLLESRLKRNVDFMVELNALNNFITDKTSFGVVKEVAKHDEATKNIVLPSQVVGVVDIPNNLLMLDRAREKANSVIRRVSEMFVDTNVDVPQTVNPDLVILPSISLEEEQNDAVALEEKPVETAPEIEVPIEFPEIADYSNSDEAIGSDNNDLFQEVVPFDSTKLFDNKYDDIFTNSEKEPEVSNMLIDLSDTANNDLNIASAGQQGGDAFWITKDDDVEEVIKTKRR